ncbi:MAG: ComEC family competence protein, partial [Comamonadaceae bacterium]
MSAISAPNTNFPPGSGVDGALSSLKSPPSWPVPALLLGLVLGAAVQLQQPALWPAAVYGGLLAAACAAGWAAAAASVHRRRALPSRASRAPRVVNGLALSAGALAMFALCGLRAAAYVDQALAPWLEGQDIRITAVVAAMPQTNEAGTRLRLDVESARLGGSVVRLPPRVDVAWYGGPFRDAAGGVDLQRQPPAITAGDRWSLTVRLKAPHGLRNPHGFDYELWAWEQGVQASGYVRAGPKDEPAVRLASTWLHPVERVRQSVRDAILERLARDVNGDDPVRARSAGVIAALVTGDQRAIDRADWDVFRATGVAHLMSISGLHITLFAW